MLAITPEDYNLRCAAVLSLTSMLISASLPAAAETVVSFIHPEQFTDARLFGGYGLEAEQPTLIGIARYLESLGGQYL